MIKENILEIKKLVGDLHSMGTYGMVELELTKIENYIKELEGKVENLTIPVVMPRYFIDEMAGCVVVRDREHPSGNGCNLSSIELTNVPISGSFKIYGNEKQRIC